MDASNLHMPSSSFAQKVTTCTVYSTLEVMVGEGREELLLGVGKISDNDNY